MPGEDISNTLLQKILGTRTPFYSAHSYPYIPYAIFFGMYTGFCTGIAVEKRRDGREYKRRYHTLVVVVRLDTTFVTDAVHRKHCA